MTLIVHFINKATQSKGKTLLLFPLYRVAVPVLKYNFIELVTTNNPLKNKENNKL